MDKFILKCNFCNKSFKLNFSFNRHIEKYHPCENSVSSHNMYERNTISDKKPEYALNLKLSKCTICFKLFDSESILVEHMNIQHNEDQTQRQDSLNMISTPLIKSSYRCHKCNKTFAKQENFDCHLLHCTYGAINLWNKFFDSAKNNEINFYVCTVCEVAFSHLLLLKSHMSSDCKSHTCGHCGKTFITKDLWSNHITDNNKFKKCVQFYAVNNKTSANNVNMIDNDCRQKIEKEKLTDTIVSNSSSDCVESNNDLFIQSVSHKLAVNDCSPDKNNEKISNSTFTKTHSNSTDAENHSNSFVHNVSGGSNILTERDFSRNMINDKILPTTVTSRTISICKDTENSRKSIVHSISENSEVNNYYSGINIKKVNNVSPTLTIVPESCSDYCLDAEHIHTSPYVNQPCDLTVNKEPEHLYSDNIERTSKYFSVKQLPNKYLSAIANDVNCEQRSQSDVAYVFICNICEMSTSTDRDSFAFHMSSHSECSIHECVVCNEVFSSVKHWKDHMTHHQTLINFRVSELLQSRTESKIRMNSNNSDTPMEPQELLRKRKNKVQTSSIHSKTKKMHIKETKRRYTCNICFKIMPSKLTLMAHKTLHSEPLNSELFQTEPPNNESLHTKPQQFSCKFCGQTFTIKRLFTKHEKIHKPQKFSCKFCGRTFTIKRLFTKHEKRHKPHHITV